MVNSCVCFGCNNSNLSGHRVHRFPNKRNKDFRAWIRFVQAKRSTFTASSVTRHTVVCEKHFTPDSYNQGDLMELRMGFRRREWVRLADGAVPSVHASPPAKPGRSEESNVSTRRESARRKRELCTILGESAASKDGAGATATSDPEDDGDISTMDPEPVEVHRGSLCNIRGLHRSLGEEEASRRNYSRRNYGHTIVKMEIKEEPCRIKDEDTEEQIDTMEVKEDKQLHFQTPHYSTNEDANIILKTEKCFTQKQTGKTGDKGSFTCSECGKSVADKSNLRRHMRIHTGEKPYTCSQCGKSFSQKSVLRDHLLRHTGVRSFSCDQCDKTFVVASNLRQHLKMHAGVKPHFCTFCGKSFSQLHSLKEHERVHTGVRPYVCLDCGKSFNISGNLKKHQRVHTGEKPYKCSHCGKSFTQSSTLRTHVKKHCMKV